jgi:hypothetical protein
MNRHRIMGAIYAGLRKFSAWHEHHEITITVFELVIAFVGMWHFVTALFELIERSEEFSEYGEFLTSGGEALIFVMLFVSIFARLAVILRERNLGQDFGAVLRQPRSKGGFSTDDNMLQEQAGFCPGDTFLGSEIAAGGQARKEILDGIARQSASQFSIRTYGGPDPMWKTWEERYLSDWLSRFPAAVWRLPPDGPKDGEQSGYFSVVVPVTEDAWNKVRYGHLSTALAAVDEQAAAYFNAPQAAPYAGPLFLLAYGVIYVPTGLKGETLSPQKLLYCGVEHIAYLLSRFHPAPAAPEAATMTMICESPNASLEAVLKTFGFVPVRTDHNLDFEHTHVRRSVAGFRMFEVGYLKGSPVIGDGAKAQRFMELLGRIARRKTREQPLAGADAKAPAPQALKSECGALINPT